MSEKLIRMADLYKSWWAYYHLIFIISDWSQVALIILRLENITHKVQIFKTGNHVCTHCGKNGHTIEVCYKKHRYPPHSHIAYTNDADIVEICHLSSFLSLSLLFFYHFFLFSQHVIMSLLIWECFFRNYFPMALRNATILGTFEVLLDHPRDWLSSVSVSLVLNGSNYHSPTHFMHKALFQEDEVWICLLNRYDHMFHAYNRKSFC